MSKTCHSDQQDDLLGEKQKEKKERLHREAVLNDLYPQSLKELGIVGATRLTEYVLDKEKWCWPWLPEREANIQLRASSTRSWMDERTPSGHRRAYPTEKRGRKPFDECEQLELQFDIWSKVKQGEDDRHQIRTDIIAFKNRFKQTPKGPEGQRIPERYWSDDDERIYADMLIITGGREAEVSV